MSFRKTSENDELTNVENTSRSKIFLQARTSDEYVNNLFLLVAASQFEVGV